MFLASLAVIGVDRQSWAWRQCSAGRCIVDQSGPRGPRICWKVEVCIGSWERTRVQKQFGLFCISSAINTLIY